jgi:flagellar motor switch protein FliM
VRVACGEVPLFEAELGKRDNRLAIRITRELPRGRAAQEAAA